MVKYIDLGNSQKSKLSIYREEILRYRGAGLSYKKITSRLELKYGVELCPSKVRGFANRISRIQGPKKVKKQEPKNIKLNPLNKRWRQ